MSYLERAITDGHAKLTGEGKQQAVPAPNGGQRDFSLSDSTGIPRSRERERMSAGQVRVVGEKQFNAERAGVRCRSLQLAERKKPCAVIECKADGVTDAEFNQAVEQACGNGTWAKFRANYVGVVAGMTRRLWFLREIRRLEREANIIADLPRQYGQRNFSLSASTGERAGVRCRCSHFPKPEKSRFYKGDPNNDIQPVSKEALIGAIKKCHQTLWAGVFPYDCTRLD